MSNVVESNIVGNNVVGSMIDFSSIIDVVGTNSNRTNNNIYDFTTRVKTQVINNPYNTYNDNPEDNILDNTKDIDNEQTRSRKKKGDGKNEKSPFRTDEELQKIDLYFRKKYQYRNRMCFLIGCNCGLRASDLLQLKWKNFFTREYEW